MSAISAAELRSAADVLDGGGWNAAIAAIMASRDAAPRRPDGRDSGEVLEAVIAALREAANWIETRQ